MTLTRTFFSTSRKPGGRASSACVPLWDMREAAASSWGRSASRRYTASPNTSAGRPCRRAANVISMMHA